MERPRPSIRFKYEELEPQFRGNTELQDLTAVSGFFGIESSSEQMIKLTGLNSEALDSIFNGRILRTHNRAHSAILARFARLSSELLDERMDKSQETDPDGKIRWLEEGKLRTSQGIMSPIQALSNSLLALEAVHQVEVELITP